MTGFGSKKQMAADKLQEPPSEWAGIKAILDEYGLQAIDFVADFKEALAQPAQKPVAWVWKDMRGQDIVSLFEPRFNSVPLYTAPPQREWVGLTDEEIAQGNKESWVDRQAFESAVWWAEAKLKEKNNG